MGLLSDYADANGGMAGLLGSYIPVPSFAPVVSPDALAAAADARNTVAAPTAPAPAPTNPGYGPSQQDGFGALLSGQGQRQSHTLLGTIGDAAQNLIGLPFNIINAEAAKFKDIPQQIAMDRAQRQLAYQQAVARYGLVGSIMNGQGGLFGATPSQAPPVVPAGQAPPPPAPADPGTPAPNAVTPPGAGGPLASAPRLGAPGAAVTPPAAAPPPAPVAAAAPPVQAPTGATAPSTGGLNIYNPQAQRTIAALELMGDPAGAQLATLGAAVAPKYDAARPGGTIYDARNGQIVSGVPQDGLVNVPDPATPGGFRNVAVPGYLENNAANVGATAGAKAAGEAVGSLPYAGALAYARAQGEQGPLDPRTIVTVPGPDGAPITMTRQQFMQTYGGSSGAPAGGLGPSGPPASAPRLGGAPGQSYAPGAAFPRGQSPAGAAFATDQARDLSGTITADQGQRGTAMQQRDNGLRALTIAAQTPFNPAKPAVYQAEKIGSIFGLQPKDMDNVAAYQQLSVGQTLAGAKSLLPSRYTERELNLTKTMYGSIKDPNTAALLASAIQAAVANKALARADYADSYRPGPNPNRQDYEAGWANTPQGRFSIYADPVFRTFQIGGKPAVVPFQGRDGRSYLAITPGLGKPTIIPSQYGQ